MIRLIRAAGFVVGCGVAGLASGNEITTYTYNALGRFTKVQISGGPGSGAQVNYQYDAAGNRQQYVVSGSSGSGSITISAFGNSANQTATGVVLAVHVSGATAPTGMVTFSENGTVLGAVFVYDGQASIILEGFALGTHTITATYAGDSANAPYTHTFTIKVRNLNWLPAVLEILLSN